MMMNEPGVILHEHLLGQFLRWRRRRGDYFSSAAIIGRHRIIDTVSEIQARIVAEKTFGHADARSVPGQSFGHADENWRSKSYYVHKQVTVALLLFYSFEFQDRLYFVYAHHHA